MKLNEWILVANGHTAKIFTISSLIKPLDLLREFSHNESREKIHNLISDKAGSFSGGVNSHEAYASASDPKKLEKKHFIKIVAEFMNKAYFKKAFNALTLMVPGHLQDDLLSELHPGAQKHIRKVLRKDYTRLTTGEILETFKEHR